MAEITGQIADWLPVTANRGNPGNAAAETTAQLCCAVHPPQGLAGAARETVTRIRVMCFMVVHDNDITLSHIPGLYAPTSKSSRPAGQALRQNQANLSRPAPVIRRER